MFCINVFNRLPALCGVTAPWAAPGLSPGTAELSLAHYRDPAPSHMRAKDAGAQAQKATQAAND